MLKDPDGIRVLSLGTMTSGDERGGQRDPSRDDSEDGEVETATGGHGYGHGPTERGLPPLGRVQESRRRRQSRREQERDGANPKERIEAAAAAMAENQKRDTDALHISFLALDKRSGRLQALLRGNPPLAFLRGVTHCCVFLWCLRARRSLLIGNTVPARRM